MDSWKYACINVLVHLTMESNDGACTNQLEREPKHTCPYETASCNPPNMYTSPVGKYTEVDN